jgi:hypothetical protein
MGQFVDLEVGLHRRDGRTWSVELHCVRSDQEVDVRLVRDGPSFDLDELRRHAGDDVAYGRLLTDTLFAVDDVREQFAKARAAADSQDVPLRLRLFVGPSAPELHDVRWETLRDPDAETFLLTNENVLFSRYLSSLDWRPVAVRPREALRALTVIANPSDLGSYRPGGRELAAVDVMGERERARAALRPIELTELVADSGGHATLNALVDCLRDGRGYDILYLVCHGFLVEGAPQLLLETEEGTVARVAGSALAERLHDLQRRPRLVMLASCQSAGSGEGLRSDDNGALAALGPRLAEAGIPAVLAMQGNISLQTMARFVPVFFKELRKDGQIDRALATARGAIRDRPDWFVPVLFMRLKSGRVWYAPGFGPFQKWPGLIADIRQGRCTPILGPGLTDALLGTRQEMALEWAESYRFPLAAHDREDLPEVAQYLTVIQDYRFPRDQLQNYLRTVLLARNKLPDEYAQRSLDELFTVAGDRRVTTDQVDPHTLLAGLPFRLYITTHPADVLAGALRAAGKQPVVELYRWSTEVDWPPSVYDTTPDYRPDPDRPLVYHLFGHLRYPETVLLAADEYHELLVGVKANRDLIPPVVRRALSDTALLFLGFGVNDEDFRVLLHSIMHQEGRGRRRRYSHVAVQIDPEERTTLEPDLARNYIEESLRSAEISVYWGSVEDFVREFQDHWDGPFP